MPYTNAHEIELAPPPIGTDRLRNEIDDLGEQFKRIDWLFEKITGTSALDLLIRPLTGDWNRIRANGEAWGNIGNAFELISMNQERAVDKLRDDHWTEGAAAEAFERHIKRTWSLALNGAAQGRRWIQKGFEILADKAIQVGEVIIDRLHKLLKLLKKKAGVLATVVGGLGDLLSGDLPFKKDFEDVKQLVMTILNLKDALERILASARKFFAGTKMIANVLTSLPEVDSGNDAAAAIRGFRQVKDVHEARQENRDARMDAKKYLDDIKKTKIG